MSSGGNSSSSTSVGPSPTNRLGAAGGAGDTGGSKRGRAGGNGAGPAYEAISSSSSAASSSAGALSSAGAPAQSSSAQQPGESTAAYLKRRRVIASATATITDLPAGAPIPGETPTAQLSWLGQAYAYTAAAMGILSAKLERQMRPADIIEVSERSPFYSALFGGIETLHTVVSPSEKYIIAHPEVALESAKLAAEQSIRTSNARVQALVALMKSFRRLQIANCALTKVQKDSSTSETTLIKRLEFRASVAEDDYLIHMLQFLINFSENLDYKVRSATSISNIPAEIKERINTKNPGTFTADLQRVDSQQETEGVASSHSAILNSKAVIALLQAANDAVSIEENRPVERALKGYVEGGFPFDNVQRVPLILDTVRTRAATVLKGLLESRGEFGESYGKGPIATLFSGGLKKRVARAEEARAEAIVEEEIQEAVNEEEKLAEAAVSSVEAAAKATAAEIEEVPGLDDAVAEEAAAGGGSSAAGDGSPQIVPDQFEGLGGGARRTRIRKNRRSHKKVRKVKKQVRKTRHHKKRSTRRR